MPLGVPKLWIAVHMRSCAQNMTPFMLILYRSLVVRKQIDTMFLEELFNLKICWQHLLLDI